MAGEGQDFWQNSGANIKKNNSLLEWSMVLLLFGCYIVMLEERPFGVVIVIHGQGKWQKMAG